MYIVFCKTDLLVEKRDYILTDINAEILMVLGGFSVQTIFSNRSD